MSIIKTLSVGNGDMFYINHNSSNFTVIDCFLSDENKEKITSEINSKSSGNDITRFISTHPDDDHIGLIEYFEEKVGITNFYCVENKATKSDKTVSFNKYCELRDSTKAYFVKKGCSRKWMNEEGDNDSGKHIGSSGISILWPVVDNSFFKEALQKANNGESPNNISPIIRYAVQDGGSALWMGDLETAFMENILDEVSFSKANILFAPHHGRKSGKVPDKWLEKINPDVIIMGEAPSANLDYAGYNNYNKITQNSAGDIVFECSGNKIDIYVSNNNYSVDFLKNDNKSNNHGCYYLGSIDV